MIKIPTYALVPIERLASAGDSFSGFDALDDPGVALGTQRPQRLERVVPREAEHARGEAADARGPQVDGDLDLDGRPALVGVSVEHVNAERERQLEHQAVGEAAAAEERGDLG